MHPESGLRGPPAPVNGTPAGSSWKITRVRLLALLLEGGGWWPSEQPTIHVAVVQFEASVAAGTKGKKKVVSSWVSPTAVTKGKP